MLVRSESRVLRDSSGSVVTGRTDIFYIPQGASSPKMQAIEESGTPGKYTVVVSGSGANISKFYWIEIGGERYTDHVYLGPWEWYTPGLNLIYPSGTLYYSSLIDQHGCSLPSSIPNARVGVYRKETTRAVKVTNVSDSSFDYEIGLSGDTGPYVVEFRISSEEPEEDCGAPAAPA